MSKITLSQQITEIDAVIREHRNAAAKTGKGQSLAQERLARAEAIRATLEWLQEAEMYRQQQEALERGMAPGDGKSPATRAKGGEDE